MSISVPGSDAGANQVTGGVSVETFANRCAHLREFRLCLALERRRRWLQGIGHGRPQASNDHDEGARKALSKRRFAHPSPPSDAVCAVVRGGVSMLRSQHFRRRMCIKKRTDMEIMKPTDRLQEIITGSVPGIAGAGQRLGHRTALRGCLRTGCFPTARVLRAWESEEWCHDLTRRDNCAREGMRGAGVTGEVEFARRRALRNC
jgi:hypothetical protein